MPMPMLRNPAVLAVLLALITLAPVAYATGGEPVCVLLFPDGGGDVLLNRCRTCRQVTVQRVRDGEGIPSVRSMMLPGETAVPLPFRGPGHTRMLGERSCPPPPGRGTSQAWIGR